MIFLRKLAKTAYYGIFPPVTVRYCSQTIYEALLYNLEIYSLTRDDKYLDRASKVADIALEIQRPDGGFCIGYHFYFGFEHRKGESTSPETLMLVALIKLYEITNCTKIKDSIEKGINWIKSNIQHLSNGSIYIPYGPSSSDSVVVYNGVSFAQAPLAMWAKITNDSELIKLAKGLNEYLVRLLTIDTYGKVIIYNEPREGMGVKDREKVDYYHLAQQAEMHFLTYQYIKDTNALVITKEFWDTLLNVSSSSEVIPYLNNDLFQNNIHVWGLSSCISAFSDAYKYYEDERYLVEAKRIESWLIEFSLSEHDHFYPVLTDKGITIDRGYYPRSDAWVIASIAKLLQHKFGCAMDNSKAFDSLEGVYSRMESNDFSGVDNHATTQFRFNLMKLAKKVLK